MNRSVRAALPLAALASSLVAAPALAAPADAHSAARPVVVGQNSITNEVDGLYRGQKVVTSTVTGFPQGAPAGVLATLHLDEAAPVHTHGRGPSVTVVDQHGRSVDVTVTAVERAEGVYDLVATQPLPRHALVRARVLVDTVAQVGDEVTSSITAGGKSATDTDAVRAMPKVTAVDKVITDARTTVRAGQGVDYVATGRFTGEVIDGATLLLKQAPGAPVAGRPVLEVRDAEGQPVVIDPERLLYSRFGDSLVWTVLGGVPEGSTFTVRAHATVSAEAKAGDVITTEFGIGLNNWAGGRLVRAVDTTTVA